MNAMICVSPQIIAEAVFDGHRLAREIDSGASGLAAPEHAQRLVLESLKP